MSSRWLSIVSLLFVIFSVSTATSSAQASDPVPRQIRFSFKLPSTAVPVNMLNVDVSMYADQAGDPPIWEEKHEIIPDHTGRVTVVLGSQTPGGIPFEVFETNSARWIGVRMKDGSELPRVMLVSVPYALKAADADTIGGMPASAFVLADSFHSSPRKIEESGAVSQSTHSAYAIPNVSEPVIVNSLAKWTDPTNLGSSAVSETGGSVGIGLSSGLVPAARLDVNGRVFSRAFSANSPGLLLANDAGATFGFVGATTDSSMSPLGFWHSGAWRMLVTSDGRVSLGTTWIRPASDLMCPAGSMHERTQAIPPACGLRDKMLTRKRSLDLRARTHPLLWGSGMAEPGACW